MGIGLSACGIKGAPRPPLPERGGPDAVAPSRDEAAAPTVIDVREAEAGPPGLEGPLNPSPAPTPQATDMEEEDTS